MTTENLAETINRYLNHWFEAVEEVAMGAAQGAGRPGFRFVNPRPGAIEALDHETIRVAAYEAGMAAVRGEQLNRLDWHWPGSHISAKHDEVDSGLFRLGKDRLQGRQVAMYVTEDGNAHHVNLKPR